MRIREHLSLQTVIKRKGASALLCALSLAIAACSSEPEPAENQSNIKKTDAGARQLEQLDRGLIAVPAEEGVLVSWRKLQRDSDQLSLVLYRNGELLSNQFVSQRTNFLDRQGDTGAEYELRSGERVLASVTAWDTPYLTLPLDQPQGGVTPDGERYSYTANDASVGDLDGDGRYEIILKWDPTNAKDNSQSGYTGNALIDAYTLEGERLWRIDMGRNIRAGAHYTQFMVYDFDGDGRSEIAMKTADGTVDGQGGIIGDPEANWVSGEKKQQVRDRTGSEVTSDGRYIGNLKGRILNGPEYFSVFEGATGRELDTVAYIPQRAPGNDNPSPEQMKKIWGDGYANRSERYLAGVAYLDGERPSAVMARGYYERSVIAAYDFSDGAISPRWVFDSAVEGVPENFGGQGNHQLSVADVDRDGKDEIVYGAMTLDHDGSPKWTAALGHGDAMHVSDLDPTRPGLELFGVYESVRRNGGIGSALIDAEDGTVLWSMSAEKDNGRGLAADIDPRYPGAEVWALNAPELFNIKGEAVSAQRPPQVNFAIWWDGDSLRELLDGTTIYKWNWNTGSSEPILQTEGTKSNNGTKANPALAADILGDWREEVIFRTEDNQALRIYSTPTASDISLTTLMHNAQYRLSVAWQNTSYNQPPHLDYDVGAKVDSLKH
ncbi:rhamnogalacturonan lyase [Gilvimarinus sp. SDUM040013]|uniref:Rhamnogalacturonan lyase n=1 Tax=Gilvimarinus gilvus TaxID=3058038 RepID=A0ABU4RX41_9GAMM|nr:rhamnogalacturonan lyase [Gilvimarinus sp. SDUM040013]MDO3386664.1 rhamnogalacturonan lyase [Gilvimarinus sp. SDUM040013]MDX6849449.1 rhamnogalacturonan lyase [Gilvimarinus sp. SDUM040013]